MAMRAHEHKTPGLCRAASNNMAFGKLGLLLVAKLSLSTSQGAHDGLLPQIWMLAASLEDRPRSLLHQDEILTRLRETARWHNIMTRVVEGWCSSSPLSIPLSRRQGQGHLVDQACRCRLTDQTERPHENAAYVPVRLLHSHTIPRPATWQAH